MSLSPLQQLLALRLHSRTPQTVDYPGAQEAGVSVVIGSNPDAVLVIRRAERTGDPWSGHMGLPGGRREAVDEHLLATAIRETVEEVGLDLRPQDLLGSLDDVAPSSKARISIFARPYVFGVVGHPLVRPNPEVALARWVPFTTLTHPGSLRDFTLEIGGSSRTFPAYHLDEGTVWGMTERILTSLLKLVAQPAE